MNYFKKFSNAVAGFVVGLVSEFLDMGYQGFMVGWELIKKAASSGAEGGIFTFFAGLFFMVAGTGIGLLLGAVKGLYTGCKTGANGWKHGFGAPVGDAANFNPVPLAPAEPPAASRASAQSSARTQALLNAHPVPAKHVASHPAANSNNYGATGAPLPTAAGTHHAASQSAHNTASPQSVKSAGFGGPLLGKSRANHAASQPPSGSSSSNTTAEPSGSSNTTAEPSGTMIVITANDIIVRRSGYTPSSRR